MGDTHPVFFIYLTYTKIASFIGMLICLINFVSVLAKAISNNKEDELSDVAIAQKFSTYNIHIRIRILNVT